MIILYKASNEVDVVVVDSLDLISGPTEPESTSLVRNATLIRRMRQPKPKVPSAISNFLRVSSSL